MIFEIVFLYFCVILVPRTTGKENIRSVYGDVVAGITKGRCVFRGCGLSRLWLWTRGYVKTTYDKRGSVVDASEVFLFRDFGSLFVFGVGMSLMMWAMIFPLDVIRKSKHSWSSFIGCKKTDGFQPA